MKASAALLFWSAGIYGCHEVEVVESPDAGVGFDYVNDPCTALLTESDCKELDDPSWHCVRFYQGSCDNFTWAGCFGDASYCDEATPCGEKQECTTFDRILKSNGAGECSVVESLCLPIGP